MKSQRNGRGSRYKIKIFAMVAAAVVTLGAGIGIADAGTRRPWSQHRPPRPAPSASKTPGKAPNTTPPKASPTPRVTASRTTPASPVPTKSAATGTVTPPPANAGFDYQIGGPYQPPAGVTVVSRDRTASPAPGLYNICYINAFQVQPGEESWWKKNHADLLLKDKNGNLVIDKDWGEILLDFSSETKRAALTSVVGGWMDECAAKGFKGVEPDNLDSYSRSNGLLTRSAALAYATSLTSRAHSKGLAVGQKNTADLSTASAKQVGFDFAVAEECADWDECDAYVATYGNRVIVIEYSQSQFTKACNAFGDTLSIVLRDVDVTTPGSGSYAFKTC